MKRRILLVDDEVAVLLTLKAVLEISGFEVETAASAKEGKSKLKNREYAMVITDMRMESDEAGKEVIRAARTAAYHPAVALLTAFPVADEDWQGMGADKMLVKPMQTRALLQQIERLLESHEAKLIQRLQEQHDEELDRLLDAHEAQMAAAKSGLLSSRNTAVTAAPKKAAKKAVSTKAAAKKSTVRPAAKKAVVKKAVVNKVATRSAPSKKTAAKKAAAKKAAAKKAALKKTAAKKGVAKAKKAIGEKKVAKKAPAKNAPAR